MIQPLLCKTAWLPAPALSTRATSEPTIPTRTADANAHVPGGTLGAIQVRLKTRQKNLTGIAGAAV